MLRKFPDMAAMMAARGAAAGRPGAGGPAAGGPAGPGAAPKAGAASPAPGSQSSVQPSPAKNQPKPNAAGPATPPAGPPQAAAAPSIQDMLDRLPRITPAELKAGDIIIVSSTNGADPSRLTAITLISGADTLLTMLAPKPPGAGQAVPNPAAGLGSGVTFGIGLP